MSLYRGFRARFSMRSLQLARQADDTPEVLRERAIHAEAAEQLSRELPRMFPAITPENAESALTWSANRLSDLKAAIRMRRSMNR